MIKTASWLCAGLIVIGLTGATPAQTRSETTRAVLREIQDAFVDLSEQVRPSVVEISSQGPITDEERSQLNDLFRFFDSPDGGDEENAQPDDPHDKSDKPKQKPEMPKRGPRATASGFIFDTKGHIVTNNHVVRGADIIEVELESGQKLPAKVVGQDPDADLAVIEIDPKGLDLHPVHLADSDGLKVGQFAIAMGSPNGFTGSFSYGHVTGLGRESLELPDRDLRFQQFIQTDAAINLGNSGGPLCDIDGAVIGVNVAIVYRANSIGFAIPSNRVRDVVPQLIEHGKMIRGWLGVSIRDIEQEATIQNVEVQQFIDANKLPDKNGSYIHALTPDGPAAKGKLENDDVIREINGKKIGRSTELINAISAIRPGDVAKIKLYRRGAPVDLDVVVGEYPGQLTARYGRDYLGIHVDTIEADSVVTKMLRAHGIKEQPSDFFVAGIDQGSAAQQAGIHAGDLIVEVGYEPVKTLAEFKKALKKEAKPGKALLLKVWTIAEDKEPRKVFVKVPDTFTLD